MIFIPAIPAQFVQRTTRLWLWKNKNKVPEAGYWFFTCFETNSLKSDLSNLARTWWIEEGREAFVGGRSLIVIWMAGLSCWSWESSPRLIKCGLPLENARLVVSCDLQSTFALHSLSRLCDALGAEERAVRVLLKKHKGGISRLSLVLDPVQVQSHSIFQRQSRSAGVVS